MASAASTAATPLRLLSSSSNRISKPFLPCPHRLTLFSPISFECLTARSAASPSPSTATSSPSGSGSIDPAQLSPALCDIIGLFQSIPDAHTRYKQLLDYAARLPPMDPALKIDANCVRVRVTAKAATG